MRVKAQIWDTSGCEKYKSITTGHYRRSVGALMFYDITNEQSFLNLDYWLRNIRENADEYVVIALVANKCDIMTTAPARREVIKERAVKYAKDNGLLFIDESSASMNIMVDEVF